KLEQNYRSTQNILDCAHGIIVKNRMRKDKKLWTEKDGGQKIRVIPAQNERHEGEIVAQKIIEALHGHETPDYRDFVVLYRINAQSRVLEEVFMRAGIPYKIVGGIKFYQRKEIKDMLAYLRVIQNPTDTVSLLRILNVPPRNIGGKTIECLQTFANTRRCSFIEAMTRADENEQLPQSKRESVLKFVSKIHKLQKVNHEFSASGVIKHVIEDTGYKKFLDDGSVEGESRLENVRELASVAAKYDRLEPGMSLSIFLEEVSLIADVDSLNEKENAVTLMTLHSAKGLEFPCVFICGLEEGLLPHSRSLLEPQELEEERRLMYVGVTRAMERLFLLFAKSRMLYGEFQNTVPSQFLRDIDENLVDGPEFLGYDSDGEFGNGTASFGGARRVQRTHKSVAKDVGSKPIPQEEGKEFFDGDKVSHATFGDGVIINIIGGIVTVAFKDPKVGIKKLAVNIAPLQKL
ncbi:MAG: 3'-5' exonuclease, partial [Patescibacteria group bacterium]